MLNVHNMKKISFKKVIISKIKFHFVSARFFLNIKFCHFPVHVTHVCVLTTPAAECVHSF